MPRYIEIQPSKIRRGDIHTDGNQAIWIARSDAVREEDGRITVTVSYYHNRPSLVASEENVTAEFANDQETVRLLRRAAF